MREIGRETGGLDHFVELWSFKGERREGPAHKDANQARGNLKTGGGLP